MQIFTDKFPVTIIGEKKEKQGARVVKDLVKPLFENGIGIGFNQQFNASWNC